MKYKIYIKYIAQLQTDVKLKVDNITKFYKNCEH